MIQNKSTKTKINLNKNTYIKTVSIFFAFILIISLVFVCYIKSKSMFLPSDEINIYNDNIIAIHQGNQLVDNVPTKGSAWVFEHADCTNGATLSWDYKTWSMRIDNLTKNTKCELYFVAKKYIVDQIKDIVAGESTSSIEVIDKGVGTDECTYTLAYDGTSDNNLRYVGKLPCNYVRYNNELWRIIGVMNNIQTDENNSNQKESLIKLRRADSLGTYAWDSSSGVNYNYGINQWGPSGSYEGSDIMRELNTDYLGNITVGTDGKWFSANNNTKAAMPASHLAIKSEYQEMIQPVLWNTGSPNNDNGTVLANNAATMTIQNMYVRERGNYSGFACSNASYCNDTVTRTTTWYGKIGLFYPTDYAYATAGGTAAAQVRSKCLGYNTSVWSNYGQCYTNSWLYDSTGVQRTMSPFANATYATYVFYVHSNGTTNANNAYSAYSIRPVIYLKSNIYITDGDGSSSKPYLLEL